MRPLSAEPARPAQAAFRTRRGGFAITRRNRELSAYRFLNERMPSIMVNEINRSNGFASASGHDSSPPSEPVSNGPSRQAVSPHLRDLPGYPAQGEPRRRLSDVRATGGTPRPGGVRLDLDLLKPWTQEAARGEPKPPFQQIFSAGNQTIYFHASAHAFGENSVTVASPNSREGGSSRCRT